MTHNHFINYCDKLLVSRNVVLLEDIALDAVLPVDEE